MSRIRFRINTAIVVTLAAFAHAGHAGVFSCDEAGLNAAIAAAADTVSPDPGPHTFNCVGPTVIPVTSNKIVTADITLDGDGLVTLDGATLRSGLRDQLINKSCVN